MADRSVKLTLRANISDFKAQVNQASSSLEELAKKADKSGQAASTGFGKLTQSMQMQRSEWEQAGQTMTVFGVAATGALAGTAKAAIDWESAFAGVKKTAGEGWNLEKLNEDLRGLARELPASHAEIAAVAEAAGQLGIHEDNIVSFTKTMINMGESTNLSADEAATTLARFANIMGTSQTKFENLGSSIVALGNNYATTEAEIADMAMRLASAGKQIGLTEGDVLGIATALSSVGIEAEAGGTAFSKVMLDMRNAVDTGSEKLQVFAQVAGMSSDAFRKLFQEDSGQALNLFIQGLGEMEAAGQSTQPVLAELGMTDIRVGNALRSSAAAADLFAGAMETGNQAFSDGTALTAEAASRYETLESKLGMLKNQVVDAAINFGTALMPAIELAANAIGNFAEFMGGLPAPVQAVVAGVTALAAVVGTAGGAFALMGPRVLDMVTAFKTLSGTFPVISVAMKGLGSALLHPIASLKTLGAALITTFRAGGITSALQAVTGGFKTLGASLVNVTARANGAKLAFGAAGLIGTLALLGDAAAEFERDAARVRQAIDEISNGGDLSNLFQVDSSRGLKEYSAALAEVANGAGTLAGMADGLNRFASNIGSFFGIDARSEMNKFKDSLNEIDAVLAGLDMGTAAMRFQELATSMGLTDADMVNLLNSLPQLKSMLISAADASGRATDDQTLLAIAMEAAANGAGDVSDSADEAARAQEELEASTAAVADAFNRQSDAFNEVIDAQRNIRGEAATLAEAQKAWVSNYEDMLEMADKTGPVLNEAADGFDMWSERGAAAHDVAEGLREAMWEQAEAMYAVGKPTSEVNAKLSEMTAEWEHVLGAMGLTSDQIEMIAEQYGLIPENITTVLDADSTKAQGVLDGYLVEIDMASGTVTIDGDTVPADGSLAALMGKVADSEGFITINGNRVPADSTVKDLVGWVLDQHPAVSVLADPEQAFSTTNSLIGRISGMKPVFQVDANTKPGSNSVGSLVAQVGRQTANIKVGIHDTGVVRQAQSLAWSISNVGAAIKVRTQYVASSYATGGYISGPGTGTSDSIPAWLSNGEYVIRAASVAKYGVAFLDKLNAGKFANGGYVDAGRFANGGYVDAGRATAQMPVSSSERGVTVNQYVQHALVEPDSKLQSDAAATARTLAGIY